VGDSIREVYLLFVDAKIDHTVADHAICGVIFNRNSLNVAKSKLNVIYLLCFRKGSELEGKRRIEERRYLCQTF